MPSSFRSLVQRSREFAESLSPLVFPPICALCGEPTPYLAAGANASGRLYATFCLPCETSISHTAPMMRHACQHCAWPLPGQAGDPSLRCGRCSRGDQLFAFSSVIALYRYQDAVCDAVVAAKYPRNTVISSELAQRLALRFRETTSRFIPPVVVHVPSPPWRQFRRGGSGTRVLAEQFAKQMQFPFRSALKTTRSIAKQAWLDDHERRQNVAGAFAVKSSAKKTLDNRDVLIVDDVMTTGATANEVARVLRNAGARDVNLAVVARAVRN